MRFAFCISDDFGNKRNREYVEAAIIVGLKRKFFKEHNCKFTLDGTPSSHNLFGMVSRFPEVNLTLAHCGERDWIPQEVLEIKDYRLEYAKEAYWHVGR